MSACSIVSPVLVDTRSWSAHYPSVRQSQSLNPPGPAWNRVVPSDPGVALANAVLPAPVLWGVTVAYEDPQQQWWNPFVIELGVGGGVVRIPYWNPNGTVAATYVAHAVAVYLPDTDPQNPGGPPPPWPLDASLTVAIAPLAWPSWAIPRALEGRT